MTSTIEPSARLADIINEHPDLARELERRSLDYCCGGQRSLADACATAGLDPDQTASELSSIGTAPPEPWTTYRADQLADHLESTHHAYLHDELPRLTALADKVADVHGARHPELLNVQRSFAELRADLEPHLAKEEQILFPMIRELVASAEAPASHCGSIENPIAVMRTEHDRAGELLEQLRAITGSYAVPDDGCASYAALYAGLEHLESDTHLHVHKENNLLFPAAVELETSHQPA
ncbi:MAG TPA: iron-sulfur cluster repair di-iron protein [Nocardioidaceae bacterium]|nr:iron-sulfur cluster repair di-iron protein [Nocardioidaceae bacterium]